MYIQGLVGDTFPIDHYGHHDEVPESKAGRRLEDRCGRLWIKQLDDQRQWNAGDEFVARIALNTVGILYDDALDPVCPHG